MTSLRGIAAAQSISRRNFLGGLAGAGALGISSRLHGLSGVVRSHASKVVVVTFGGGARDEETFAPEGQENIPHLLEDLLPQGTFFTQVVNMGILGHYVATASIATGVYETLNNFAAVSPDHPTVFEYYRRDLKRPAKDAWVIAPSNGFNRIGASNHRGYGPDLGAEVLLPKQLLAAALAGGTGLDYEHILRDNYETPLFAPELSRRPDDLHRMADLLRLSLNDFSTHARSLSSPDELSVFLAKRLMVELAPSLVWITLHDIDRSDRLCAEIWQTIQTNPEYKDRTAMFILPDFGRDADTNPAGNGFQHHRTGDALSRTTWMLALGPGIRHNAVVDRAVSSLDLVPTLGTMLGFNPSLAQGKPLYEVL
jgi:hypothetical protein